MATVSGRFELNSRPASSNLRRLRGEARETNQELEKIGRTLEDLEKKRGDVVEAALGLIATNKLRTSLPVGQSGHSAGQRMLSITTKIQTPRPARSSKPEISTTGALLALARYNATRTSVFPVSGQGHRIATVAPCYEAISNGRS